MWVYLAWALVTMALAERYYSSQAAFHTCCCWTGRRHEFSKPTKFWALALERMAARVHRVARIRADKGAKARDAEKVWRSTGTYEQGMLSMEISRMKRTLWNDTCCLRSFDLHKG